MKSLPENILYSVLENADLYPEDKGLYFKIKCPSCGHKEAFIYKNNFIISCSRKNKCGFSGSIEDLINNDPEIRKKIAKTKTIFLDKKEKIKETSKLIIPNNTRFFSEESKGFIYNQALSYLQKRKIHKNVINELGYVCNPNKNIKLGIFIPFFEDKKLVYYVIRNINKKSKFRFINPKEVKSSEFLFNYDKFLENETICIFEGLFDAMSIENFVGTAMLTSSLSKPQASKIFDKSPKRIIYIPDNDLAGVTSLERNINLLNYYKPPSLKTDIYIWRVPKEYKDFNEYCIKENYHEINIIDCKIFNKRKKNIIMKRKSPL